MVVGVVEVVCIVVLVFAGIAVATIESAPVADIMALLVFGVVLVKTVMKSTGELVGVFGFV